jgi:hypothetical protein
MKKRKCRLVERRFSKIGDLNKLSTTITAKLINPFTNRLIINQLYANLQNNINMFYIVRNLQTEVPFAHS